MNTNVTIIIPIQNVSTTLSCMSTHVYTYSTCIHQCTLFIVSEASFLVCSMARIIYVYTECLTVPFWAGQSRFGGKCPASRGDLARDAFCPALGKKVTYATARPTCRMQSTLSCICQSTKTARGGTRQRTAHVERQSTRTHVHMYT